MTKKKAAIELIFAGSLWGFGFVATTWALQSFTAAEVLVYRFAIAFLFGEIFSILFFEKKIRLPNRGDILLSIPGGVLLSGLLVLQTIGLQYTTATNSAFITTLYVILVPIIGHLFLKQKAQVKLYLYVLMALAGTTLLVGLNLSTINRGDLWTLACALVAAIHIIYIGQVTSKVKNSFRFNNLQSLWSVVLLIPLLFSQQKINFHATSGLAWFGILFLAIASSTIGFYIQVRSQKVLSNTTASMLFLLESPFAFIFGSLFLKETLTSTQFLGVVLILLASYLTIHAEKSTPTI